MIDLHTHTNESDGSFSPALLVELAEKMNLSAVAITDHDTVSGVSEAIDAATGITTVVPGIEFSANQTGCVDCNCDLSVHIVGLFIDHTHSAILKAADTVLKMRRDRNLRMLKKLEELNMPLSIDELQKEAGGDGKIAGRVHFANLLVKKGYVKNRDTVFSKYIGNRGMAIVPKERLSFKKVIEAITDSGGVAILAHPHAYNLKDARLRVLLKELVDYGLQGIECFYSGYHQNQIVKYSRFARDFGLVRSGGSDFHGLYKPNISLGTGIGSLYIDDCLLDPIRNLARLP